MLQNYRYIAYRKDNGIPCFGVCEAGEYARPAVRANVANHPRLNEEAFADALARLRVLGRDYERGEVYPCSSGGQRTGPSCHFQRPL